MIIGANRKLEVLARLANEVCLSMFRQRETEGERRREESRIERNVIEIY